MTGSNRRPPPCKGGALPAELITQSQIFLLYTARHSNEWWVMTGSNRRPPPCKGGALPAELITPAVWSRIIGIVAYESTLFKTKMVVRCKISRYAVFLGVIVESLRILARRDGPRRGYGVEESRGSDRILPTLSRLCLALTARTLDGGAQSGILVGVNRPLLSN